MPFPLTTEQLRGYADAYTRKAHSCTRPYTAMAERHHVTEHDRDLEASYRSLADRITAVATQVEAGITPQIGVLVLNETVALFGEYVIDTIKLRRDAQRIPNYAGHQACLMASGISSCIQDAASTPARERDLWIRIRSCLTVLSKVGYALPAHVLAPTPRAQLLAALRTLKHQHGYLCHTHLDADDAARWQTLRDQGRYLVVAPGDMAAFDGCERQVKPMRLCWAGDAALICSVLTDAGLQVQNVPTSPDQPIVLVPVNTAPII
ncbi:MAG TPA: hypothetical protein VFZ66_27500 [Herpetosiphonaceae bacterium]